MNAKNVTPWLLLASLSLWCISCTTPKKDPIRDELQQEKANEEGRRNLVGPDYRILMYHDGSMYVGTVVSVRKMRSDLGNGFLDPPAEGGVFLFRVDKTVIGPSRKELTLGFWWIDEKPHNVVADWVCNSGPWKRRPRPGDRLLLLLTGDKKEAEHMNGEGFGPVWSVGWDVAPDHPFVKALDDVRKYLRAGDEERDKLFIKLSQSEWSQIRGFAWSAVWDGHNAKVAREQPRRMLQCLKFAVPKISDDDERMSLSAYRFCNWLSLFKDDKLADDLSARIEDWYLTELRKTDNLPRCKAALEGLKRLFDSCGVRRTLDFFKKRGPAVLEAHLSDCARSKDAVVEERSKELLQMLHRSHEPAKEK